MQAPMRERLRRVAEARAKLARTTRTFLSGRGYLEVETPILVPAPGMEPHIDAFATELALRELGGRRRRLWLQTSPEYAMKRLVAGGLPRIYQITKVFRAEPPSATHAPEFSMLEFYREGDMHGVMEDLEALVGALARAFTSGERLPGGVDVSPPFLRLTVRQALLEYTGVDFVRFPLDAAEAFAAALAKRTGRRYQGGWDEVFFGAFLDFVEPAIGRERPTFLVDWPAHMAALARLRDDDPRFAERFELYAGGLELANGFSELNDAAEQRRRLEAEQAERRRAGREVYPIDERFVEAVGRLPPTGGVAVGLDRLLMLLLGEASIEGVLLFSPQREWMDTP